MSRRSRKRNRAMMNNQNKEMNNQNKEMNNQNKEMNNMEIKTCMVSLDSALLERDFSYQRPVNMNRVKEIVAEFDPDLVNILKVSFRDGHYYVFDGSHTLEALRIVNAKEHFQVICKLYKGLTYEREAQLFALQNGNATRVGTPYKMRALERAGDTPTVQFLEATRGTGFEISPGERTSKKNTIAAVCKASAVYDQLGEEQYKAMLKLIKETWDGESWSVSQNMLSGMAIFYKTFGDKLSKDRFVKKLCLADQISILKAARKHDNLPVGYQYAYAIAQAYNAGGGKGCLLLKKLTIHMIEEEEKE